MHVVSAAETVGLPRWVTPLAFATSWSWSLRKSKDHETSMTCLSTNIRTPSIYLYLCPCFTRTAKMSAPSGIKVSDHVKSAFTSAQTDASDVRAMVFVIQGGEPSLSTQD